MGFASLRTGEALGLRRCDVDPLHGEVWIVVQAQELRGLGRAVLDHAKTDSGRRTVAVPRIVVDALLTHMERFTNSEPDAPVFTGPQHSPLRRATLSVAWRDAKEKAGAPTTLRLYDLRHDGATLTARMPGVTTKELIARIGHTSWRAALIYQHATAERDRTIANFLDAQVTRLERPAKAQVIDLGDGSRGVGVGLDTTSALGRNDEKAS